MLRPYSIFQISYAGQARLPSESEISPSNPLAKILILIIDGGEKQKIGKDYWYLCNPVMSQLQIVILSYLLIINLIAFVLYGVDKKRAIRNEFRIRERVLLWMARLGGGIGSWIGLKLFRHKTKHTKFRIVVPPWTLIWIAAVVFAVIKIG